jgi:polysaccharide pyruvyl transferase WcaK-like protein
MEAILAYLRTRHQNAVVDAMCPAPERMMSRYGIPATAMFSQAEFGYGLPKPAKAVFLAVEKCIDLARIMAWTRSHDVVIIPGMGVLEATLPVRPWETPYGMLLLSLSGRIFKTKVALVSVGAGPVRVRATRWLQDWSARLANYRSYRDEYSRDAMAKRGIDTSRDALYPDLAFSVPLPHYDPGDERTVGIGVMQYSGGNDDRDRAAEINSTYKTAMKQFAGWLVDNGYRVFLFIGDEDDQPVADEIVAFLRQTRPGIVDSAVVAKPVSCFTELTDFMQQAGFVVGTRFHNIVCALRLGKPTISVSYGTKIAALMEDGGLGEFIVPASVLDAGQLIERFKELEARAAEVKPRIRRSAQEKARLAEEQYARLARELFAAADVD